MPRADALSTIARMRFFRAPPAKDQSIAGEVSELVQSIRRAEKTNGTLDAALGALARAAPGSIARGCVPVALTRGVLTVRCEDSAAAYNLDQWLRSGGLERVRAELAKIPAGRGKHAKPMNIVRVRVEQ